MISGNPNFFRDQLDLDEGVVGLLGGDKRESQYNFIAVLAVANAQLLLGSAEDPKISVFFMEDVDLLGSLQLLGVGGQVRSHLGVVAGLAIGAMKVLGGLSPEGKSVVREELDAFLATDRLAQSA